MNRDKIRAARRAGFIYGLFRASPIPTEILPKNLAREALERAGLEPPKTIEGMRREIKTQLGYDAVGFVPNKEKTDVRIITQPYRKRRAVVDEGKEEAKDPGEDELEIEPELYVDVDEPELEIKIDKKMKEKARKKKLKAAQAAYQAKKAAQAASSRDDEYNVYRMFK